MGDDAIDDAVYAGPVLQAAHASCPAADLPKRALDGVGGAHPVFASVDRYSER